MFPLLRPLLLVCVAALPCAASPVQDASAVRRQFAEQSVWVIGERHRVAAGHELFEALVADALHAGERVLVGLEIPADRQAALEEALAGQRGAPAPAVIDSPSYRNLLTRLGELSQVYPGRLTVRAIDTPHGGGQNRDRHMAETLHRWHAEGQRVMALVGNLHALKAPLGLEGRGGLRLAARLEAAGLGVASLLQLGPDGATPTGATGGVLAATAEPAAPALAALASLVQGEDVSPGPWLAQGADAVILRP